MLRWRLLMSAILIPTLIGIFWLDQRAGAGAPWLFALCLLLSLRSAWELVDLTSLRTMRPSYALAGLGAAAVTASAWLPHWEATRSHHLIASLGSVGCIGVTTAFCLLMILAGAAARFEEPGTSVETAAAEFLTVGYCGVLVAITAQLRWLHGGDWGYLALGSVVVGTKAGDIGGYTLGRLFGRRKMAPKLSPGKTWAGFGGAVLGASLGVWCWLSFAPEAFIGPGFTVRLASAIAYGMMLGVVGLVGDLCESLIKRDVGRKDAAAILPGFGGLLDLLDSVLFAGPFGWLWWILWPPIMG